MTRTVHTWGPSKVRITQVVNFVKLETTICSRSHFGTTCRGSADQRLRTSFTTRARCDARTPATAELLSLLNTLVRQFKEGIWGKKDLLPQTNRCLEGDLCETRSENSFQPDAPRCGCHPPLEKPFLSIFSNNQHKFPREIPPLLQP